MSVAIEDNSNEKFREIFNLRMVEHYIKFESKRTIKNVLAKAQKIDAERWNAHVFRKKLNAIPDATPQ